MRRNNLSTFWSSGKKKWQYCYQFFVVEGHKESYSAAPAKLDFFSTFKLKLIVTRILFTSQNYSADFNREKLDLEFGEWNRLKYSSLLSHQTPSQFFDS